MRVRLLSLQLAFGDQSDVGKAVLHLECTLPPPTNSHAFRPMLRVTVRRRSTPELPHHPIHIQSPRCSPRPAHFSQSLFSFSSTIHTRTRLMGRRSSRPRVRSSRSCPIIISSCPRRAQGIPYDKRSTTNTMMLDRDRRCGDEVDMSLSMHTPHDYTVREDTCTML